MDETPQWVSLNLDPGTAQFLGLPPRLHVPATSLSAMEQGLSAGRLARALSAALEQNPGLGNEHRIQRFLSRSTDLEKLENYLRVGNITFAGQIARKLYEKDPQDPLALSTLGRLSLLEDDAARAGEYFQRALETAPTHGPTQLEWALALAGSENPARALEILKELEERQGIGLLARIWRWEIEHAHLHSLGDRLEFLRRVLQQEERQPATGADLEQRFPGNPETRYLIAVHPTWSEPEGSRIAALRSVLRDAPYHVNARILLAHLLRRSGNPEEALDVLNKAPQNNEPLVLAAVGMCLEHLARSDEARAAYRSVFEQDLKAVPHAALIQAGHGLLRVGNHQETRMLLEDAVAARAGDSLPRQILARLEELEGDADACERRLRQAQKECGRTPGLAYALGDFLRRHGRDSEAAGMFKTLVSQEPESPWGHRGLGDLALKENAQQAVDHYSRALALEPDTPIPGYDYLQGVAALRAGQFEKAEACLARAVAGEPDNARYWCDLGATHFYLQRVRQAIAATERAVALDPGNPGFPHNLAQYHEALFKSRPFGEWKSYFMARRLRARAGKLARASKEWTRDLWGGPSPEA